MPDTGAPWNIPYVDPTDLVRDYPQASEDLADAIAAGLSAAGAEGIGPNVVQTVLLAPFTTTSTSFTTITGLTASITPSSDTSKILVIADVKISADTTNRSIYVRLAGGNATTYVGNADGSRVRAASGVQDSQNDFDFSRSPMATPIMYLDSPGVDTAVTYSIEIACNAGTAFVNRSGQDANSTLFGRHASSITVIEVQA
jgi:hypothetical protein